MALKLYLLDTNTAIDYISGILPAKAIAWLDSVLDQEVAISVINQIEMLGFSPLNPDDIIPFEELASTVEIVPLDGKIVALTISLRKTHKIKLPDAVIAATALDKSLILLSRNSADFKNIENLELRNLHDMI